VVVELYYVLYNKDFEAIGKRKTYQVSSWSYKRKAFEFSELDIEGSPIETLVGACYVGLHEDRGTVKAIMYSGVPKTEKGKTVINAVDVRQLLNCDAVIDLTTVDSVSNLYTYLLSRIVEEYSNLGANIAIDTSELEINPINFNEDAIERTRAKGNVWKTLQAVNAIYDCYIDVIVNLNGKTITFKVIRIKNEIKIKLSDFDLPKIKNDFTSVNRVICLDQAYVDGTSNENKVTYYLLSDDTVVSESEVLSVMDKVIYPPRMKVFVDEDINKAKAQGIQELYKNRFKANVELSKSSKMGYLLDRIEDLSWKAHIYGFNSSDNLTYKTLPVMEISEDEKGMRKVKFGRLEEYWWL
jgi:hypothetical protein